MVQVITWLPEDRASNSKWQRLYTDDIVELILDKDSNVVISDCDQCDNDVTDNAWRKCTLIISMVINLAKEKIWHPIQIMIWLHCFHVLFCSIYYSVERGNQLVPSTLLRHIKQLTFPSTWHHRIWNASFSGDYYSTGTRHTRLSERLLDWNEQFLTPFYSKQNNDTWQGPTYYWISPFFNQWQCYWQ